MPFTSTAPWAGPGNSEGGPADPEEPFPPGRDDVRDIASADDSAQALIRSDPWPGPGNSEA